MPGTDAAAGEQDAYNHEAHCRGGRNKGRSWEKAGWRALENKFLETRVTRGPFFSSNGKKHG